MDTDFSIKKVMDISKEHGSWGFDGRYTSIPLDSISAFTLSLRIKGSTLAELQERCLSKLVNLIDTAFPHYNIWLLVSNSAWQPNSKVVKHLKLWKSFSKRGVDVSFCEKTIEVEVKSDEGIKYFGAIKINNNNIREVISVVKKEYMSFIISTDMEILPYVDEFIKYGWAASTGYDVKFNTNAMSLICASKGLFIKVIGEFDDAEAGVSVVLAKDQFSVLERLAES